MFTNAEVLGETFVELYRLAGYIGWLVAAGNSLFSEEIVGIFGTNLHCHGRP